MNGVEKSLMAIMMIVVVAGIIPTVTQAATPPATGVSLAIEVGTITWV